MSSVIDINSIEELLASMNLSAYQKHAHFHILRLNDHLYELPRKLSLRSKVFFEMTFSQASDTFMDVDRQSIETHRDHLLFLSPGQTYSIDSTQSNVEADAYITFFTHQFLDFAPSNYHIIRQFPFFNMNSLPAFYTHQDMSDLYVDYMRRMYHEFQNLNSDSIEIIKSLLTIVLFETKRKLQDKFHFVPQNSSRKEEITYRFENLIKQTKKMKRPLSYYAEKLHISAVYLSECIKETSRKTAKVILNEYILLEAQTKLLNSTSTIENIADDLGFADRSHFINFYKKHSGLTPNQERKKHQETH